MPEPLADRFALTPARRLVLAAFVMDLAVAIVGLSVQFRGQQLGATPLQLGLLGTFSSLAYTAVCLFSGSMSDRVGRRALASAACLGLGVVWVLMTRAGTPGQLLALVPFSGAFVALYWPPVQAWLSQVSEGPRRLIRNIGDFNLAWSVGLMLGPPMAGLLWAYGWSAPFFVAAALVYGLLVFMQTVSGGRAVGAGADGEACDAAQIDGKLARQYLHLAWFANFGAWFSRGLTGVVFPKLGLELGMSERVVGIVIATFLTGQLAMFVYLRARSGWEYRLWPLVAALGCGGLGMALAAVAHTPVGFALAFAISGVAAGVTYAASLYYSLHGHEVSRGARAGIHEAVLGSGIFLGPLVGGLVANYWNLHAPFLVAAGVFWLLAAVDVAVWQNTVRPTRAALNREREAMSR